MLQYDGADAPEPMQRRIKCPQLGGIQRVRNESALLFDWLNGLARDGYVSRCDGNSSNNQILQLGLTSRKFDGKNDARARGASLISEL